jgi:ribosomal protein S18 acetylase RimI-like enzyme
VDDRRRRLAGLSDDAVRRVLSDAPIRPASVADADAIAALHAASWRSAYRGIFKDSTLGPVLDDERRTHWNNKLAAMTADDTVLVAGDNGFIAVWAKGDPGFGAYIDNLHVHPERRSGGLGRRLLGEAMRRVARRGERGAYLWVFDDNVRAIDFYRRLGGEIVEGGFDEIDGTQVAHSRIAWRDTARLADACGA